MRRIATLFRESRLSVKIITMFAVVLLLTSGTMYTLFSIEQNNLRYAEFDRIAQQNTQLIANNIDAMMVNASYITKMLITNSSVQKLLLNQESFNSPAVMQVLRTLLASVTNLQPNTAGLYLFNTRAQRFGMDNYTMHTFAFQQLEDAAWFPEAQLQSGYYIIKLNGGETYKLYGNENVISMIRLIYHIEQPTNMLGAVMLNLRESYFSNSFAEFEQKYNAEVTIVDDTGNHIFSGDHEGYDRLTAEQQTQLLAADRTGVSLSLKDKTHVSYSSFPTQKAPWHVIVALPYTGDVQGLMGARTLFILLLIMEALLIFVGTLIITRLVAQPLQRLTDAMRLTDGAQPKRVDIPFANGEIRLLKNTYNRMVERIDVLIQRIQDESERKRQAEFHALQAQINPHFLYNTIDTARGLTVAGRTAEVNRLLRNLGEFYRNSISNGRNVITLREEIHMVRSYMDIQQIRYADIHTTYDVDDAVCDVLLPKLVLQPLVENALYHGLRPMGNKGSIHIRAWGDASLIYVSVSDDGAGIDPAVVRSIFDGAGKATDQFGLHGTIDRLRLFYRQDHVLSIEYGMQRGTKMTLLIPKNAKTGDLIHAENQTDDCR